MREGRGEGYSFCTGASNTPLLSQVSAIHLLLKTTKDIKRVQKASSALCQRPGRTAVLALKAGREQGKNRLLQHESLVVSAQNSLQPPLCPEYPHVCPTLLTPRTYCRWTLQSGIRRHIPHAPVAFLKKPLATPSNLILGAPRLYRTELYSAFIFPFITRRIIRQYKRWPEHLKNIKAGRFFLNWRNQ